MLDAEGRSIAGADRTTIHTDVWALYLALSSDEHVLDESQEVADGYGKGRSDAHLTTL
jgi:hypothetical protein